MAHARRVLLALVAAVCGLLLIDGAAFAAFDPYPTGSSGYDFSYLECGATAPRGTFGIVGVNAGYPFTYYNSCLGAEFAAAAAQGNGSLYVNTGYDPSYTAVDGRHTTQDCANRAAAISGTSAQQAAWAVGCSEAERDLDYATAQGAGSPSAWWLDVETANSWSATDLSLNRYALQGLIDQLRSATAAPVGVYSTPYQWTAITGGYQAPVDADWLATGQATLRRAARSCATAGFTGAKIWLVQYGTSSDRDYAC